MREATPTRAAALELADERKLMRQGYEFLDEKRTLLAAEILRQLRLYEEAAAALGAAMRYAARALAAAVERHGLDGVQVQPAPAAPRLPPSTRSLFLGITTLAAGEAPPGRHPAPPASDPSPEAAACRAAFEESLSMADDIGARSGNLHRLAGEYRRTERRARALEKVLLPEVEDAIKRVDEQLDTMEREETIRIRWAHKSATFG
ncbi:MAG TPA: V-type ATP synthase subunit D [Pseudolabrys sp.]|nr:V-type ATP synthase subunit D [Pseudolabrys sp.]